MLDKQINYDKKKKNKKKGKSLTGPLAAFAFESLLNKKENFSLLSELSFVVFLTEMM